MRLPTQPRARGVLLARFARAVLAAALALSLSASAVLASRWTVDLAGGGDFTTIQAALDQQAIEFRDTVLVMPGEYAETIAPPVFGPGWTVKTALVSAGGAAVTSLQSLTVAPYTEERGYANIDGFTFIGAVTFSGYRSSDYPFVRCVFLGPVSWNAREGSGGDRLAISDCDFYARTTLLYFHGSAQRLRFHSAPLTVSSTPLGTFVLQDCRFEGPADTLVHVPGLSSEGDLFERCSFADASYGIVFQGRESLGNPLRVDSSRFTDLSQAGIWMHDTTSHSGHDHLFSLDARDSRFDRCGTGIHWVYERPTQGGQVRLLRDTIYASSGDGLRLGSAMTYGPLGILDCVVEGNGGHGAALIQNEGGDPNWFHSNYPIWRSRFVNNAGDGLRVLGRDPRPTDLEEDPGELWRTRVVGSTFAGNGGAGVRIESQTWRVDSCVAIGNGGDGFSLHALVPTFMNDATRNTSALNRGDGFRFSSRGAPADSLFLIERNLAVMNTGAGIRVPFNGGLRHFAFNDAWGNYLAQYIAPGTPADSNLTVDPRFCALGAGDLTLEQGSPCGAGGVYGLIGALPEACPNTLDAGPGAPSGVAFVVRPSVARGSVEFVPPATGGEGVVEVFDLAGRVLWRAPLGPATGAVRWRGEGDSGRLRAGLYWARFTRGEERVARRLVWLE